MSDSTTRKNERYDLVDCDLVENKMRVIKELIGDRALFYLGARHFGADQDAAIGAAAIRGGADGTSTDAGSSSLGVQGMGTIPHSLENVFAWKYGAERAVVETTLAFDRHIDKSVPRIALCDYRNKEITDSIATAQALKDVGSTLSGIRVDTAGENVAEGAFESIEDPRLPSGIRDLIPEGDKKFWAGTGVTVSGVLSLRLALDEAGFEDVKIVLSSGFGDVSKVTAFVRAEEILGVKLFDSLGVGGVYKPCRAFTSDIVSVSDTLEGLDNSPCSKVGRSYKPNDRLEEYNLEQK